MANWGPIRFPDYSISQYAQPKQRFSFIVLYQLPSGMSEVENGGIEKQAIQGQLGRDQFPAESIVASQNTKNVSDLLTISTKTFPDLSWVVTPQTDNHFFNSKIHWAGKRTYVDTVNITFREYVTSPITRLFKNWQRLANDPVTNNIGYQNKYKGMIVKLEIDPNVFHDTTEMLNIEQLLPKLKKSTQKGFDGDLEKIVTRQIVLDGIWPSTINDPGNDYSDNGTLQDCSVTFHCDRYFEDKDWQRYLDSDEKTAQKLQQQQ